jgi:hypothetical protein
MSDDSSNASSQLEGEVTFEPDVQEENPSIDMQTLLSQMQSRETHMQAEIDALRATILRLRHELCTAERSSQARTSNHRRC